MYTTTRHCIALFFAIAMISQARAQNDLDASTPAIPARESRFVDSMTRCAIQFPTKPKTQVQKAVTPDGDILIRSHVLEGDGVVMMLSHALYPESFLKAHSVDPLKKPEQFVKLACDGALKGRAGSRIVHRTTIKLKGSPGIEQVISFPEGTAKQGPYPAGVSYQRCFVREGGLYTLMVDFEKTKYQKDPKHARRTVTAFLVSFDFLDE